MQKSCSWQNAVREMLDSVKLEETRKHSGVEILKDD